MHLCLLRSPVIKTICLQSFTVNHNGFQECLIDEPMSSDENLFLNNKVGFMNTH